MKFYVSPKTFVLICGHFETVKDNTVIIYLFFSFKAEVILCKLRGGENVEKEIDSIRTSIHHEKVYSIFFLLSGTFLGYLRC
jgi:hypothetical protein